jgi:hypothetical protein
MAELALIPIQLGEGDLALWIRGCADGDSFERVLENVLAM